jgi:hypothetical protein
VAIQSDGRIVAAGFSYNGANYDFALARYISPRKVTCLMPMLATGGAATWCSVTNGSNDDSTMIFNVIGFEGGSYSGLPGAINIPDTNSPRKGETILYYFKGRKIYKGTTTNGTAVVSDSDLAGLPATGSGFYAAQMLIYTGSAAVQNIAMSCFQLDPFGPKRPLMLKCY